MILILPPPHTNALNNLNLDYSSKITLLGIFVLSGFAGLIYQSIWSRYLGIFLGHAAYAQALVLSIFMGGMALGAMIVAKSGEKWRNLIRKYAIIEGIIGILGLLFHWIFTAAAGFSYDVLLPSVQSTLLANIIRWVVAAILIVPQTVLLGMTFPLMSSGMTRRFPNQDGSLLGGLYFTNSIGAAFGALIAVFILLPWIGLQGAMLTAGILNLAVAALALMLADSSKETIRENNSNNFEIQKSPLLKLVLFSTALSGAASFVYEIVWIRMLGMAVGSTLHAFELMLASFIAGIAFGGLWIRKRADSSSSPLKLAGYMQIGMGLAALLSLVVYGSAFEWVGYLMTALANTEQSYELYTFGTAVIAIIIMLPAAFFAGTTLPLFTVALLRTNHGERSIGQVYAYNTIGSIFGVLAAMHILIPGLGLKLALVIAALIDMGIGVYLLRSQADNKKAIMQTAFAGIFVLAATGIIVNNAPFDPARLTSGVFRYGANALNNGSDKVLFYEDGKTASISMKQQGKFLQIATNGKIDATINLDINDSGNRAPDELTMVSAVALPLAMHNNPEEIGIIGFGSGMSTHTVLADKRVKKVDTIEIEEVIVKAARMFGEHVENAYIDKRSNIIIDDAKSYFSGQKAKYDIIMSEPSNPWISGVGTLFSKEFYQFIPRHLKPNGLFVQWIQLYEIDDKLVSSVLNALTPVFSDYRAYITDSDMIIVAKYDGELPSLSRDYLYSNPDAEIVNLLKRQGLNDIEFLNNAAIADAKLLRAYGNLYGGEANSWYKPILSLEAPKTRYMNAQAQAAAFINRYPNLLLEGLNITRPVSMNESIPLIYRSGLYINANIVKARFAAEFIKTGNIKEEVPEFIELDSLFADINQLRNSAKYLCEANHNSEKPFVFNRTNLALSSALKDLVNTTLIYIPSDAQNGVLIPEAGKYKWLNCAPERVSTDFARTLELLDAVASRNWSKMQEVGINWFENPITDKAYSQNFDEVALISVLISYAHDNKWNELIEAEKQLSKKTARMSNSSTRTLQLLLSMADLEKDK